MGTFFLRSLALSVPISDYDAIMKNFNAIAIALTNENFNAIAISNNG